MKKSSWKKTIFFGLCVLCLMLVPACSTFTNLFSPGEEPTISATRTRRPTRTIEPTFLSTKTPAPTATATRGVIPTSSLAGEPAVVIYEECRRVVNGLKELKSGLGFPDSLFEDPPRKPENGFDPNSYFTVMTHLNMAPGYTLDYLYFADDLGGLPLVYARRTGDEPFLDYEAYLQSYGEEMSGERSYGSLGHQYDFLESIQVDQTPESYFDYAALSIVAQQFYLFWHGLYNDDRIFCDAGDMQYVLPEMEEFDLDYPPGFVEELEKIDFAPQFLDMGETVKVRFVTYTKWGGFFENVLEMEKSDPFNLINVDYYPILEYEIPLAF